MTVELFIDAAERFPLGARNGVVTPTAEPISDTAVTPFGLTLRTTPIRRNVVRIRAVNGVLTMDTSESTYSAGVSAGTYSAVWCPVWCGVSGV